VKSLNFLIIIIFISFSLSASDAVDKSKELIIFAGQSNALGWRGNPSYLPENSSDSDIMFYFYEGVPPGSHSINFNSTSGNEWTTLAPQIHDPYIALEQPFFGPEITLARKIYQSGSDLMIFKCAVGGTDLANDWNKSNSGDFPLYKIMMEQLDTAFVRLNEAGIDFKIAGFFWMQGESDAADTYRANAYENNLRLFIQNIRTDLNSPELPFIIGRIGNKMGAPLIHYEIVRTAQVHVAETDPFVEWIDTDDFSMVSDNLHYDSQGLIDLGERIAAAYLTLPTGQIEKNREYLSEYTLYQNYPNPFNPATAFSVYLPNDSIINLTLFNSLGEEVRNVASGLFSKGKSDFTVSGLGLSSGVYLYRLNAKSIDGKVNHSESKKMIFLK